MHPYQLVSINPRDIKVHLAVWNGHEDPLEVYFSGRFKEWQEDQRSQNFRRPLIFSLIKLPGNDVWLFAGVFQVNSVRAKPSEDGYIYDTTLSDKGSEFIGRLVVNYSRKGRNSYRLGESIFDDCSINSILPEPMQIAEFSDFKSVLLSRSELALLYRHQYPGWRSALSSVAGVYLISDRLTGKLYVGSAYGEGGFWSRWASYNSTCHGGNSRLVKLLASEGEGAFESFHYSILETCDIGTSPETVIAIENRWKKRLLSREFGYNDN